MSTSHTGSGVLAKVRMGDSLIWNREERYGPPVRFVVTGLTPARVFAEAATERWTKMFRRSDGRVIGSRQNMFFVVPEMQMCLRGNGACPKGCCSHLTDEKQSNKL